MADHTIPHATRIPANAPKRDIALLFFGKTKKTMKIREPVKIIATKSTKVAAFISGKRGLRKGILLPALCCSLDGGYAAYIRAYARRWVYLLVCDRTPKWMLRS